MLKAACRLILRDCVTSIELAKISMVQDRTWLGHQTLAIENVPDTASFTSEDECKWY
jgi:hypothetical protein